MKNFVVSARKYRPDTFDTVIGQTSVTRTLKNAISSNHLAHAYLFCGPRGIGKTTCARIFAKSINCMNLKENTEACNECDSCKSFNESRAFNIHELDAASNNSVDDIRNLIDQIRIPPQVGRYSIYIIDEVHMLSQQAFNAFLKTLEEPPSHAVFILATTEKHKIIPTILSRCQIFDFNRISPEDIVNYLSDIARKENIQVEPEALGIIAQKADGSMRDALSVFDQIASFTNYQITYNQVIENLNVLDYKYYFDLTDSLLRSDMLQALLIFNSILQKGFDAHNFINGLAKHFRDLLVCRDEQTLVLLETGKSVKDRYRKQAAGTSPDFLFRALEIINDCDINYKASKNQRLLVELALIQISRITGEKKNRIAEENDKVLQAAAKKTAANKETSLRLTDIKNKPETDNPEKKPELNAQTSVSIKDALKKMQNKDQPEEIHSPESDDPDKDDDGFVAENSFTQEELLKQWGIYATKIKEEMPRSYSILKSQAPVLKDGNIINVTLINKSQAEDFESRIKEGLIEFLRETLHNKLITIEITLSDEASNNTRKPYTSEEKFKHMAEKNPVLRKLKQDLNLDFE